MTDFEEMARIQAKLNEQMAKSRTAAQQAHYEAVTERNRITQERGVPAPASCTYGKTKKGSE